MSKSKPQSCIFVHDSSDEIKNKLKKAYCPERVVENNPILEYCKHLIFKAYGKMEIKRPSKFGGDISFGSYEELEDAFRKGDIHPLDLKNAAAEGLEKMIKPIRRHFEKNAKAKKLYEFVKRQDVTR